MTITNIAGFGRMQSNSPIVTPYSGGRCQLCSQRAPQGSECPLLTLERMNLHQPHHVDCNVRSGLRTRQPTTAVSGCASAKETVFSIALSNITVSLLSSKTYRPKAVVKNILRIPTNYNDRDISNAHVLFVYPFRKVACPSFLNIIN